MFVTRIDPDQTAQMPKLFWAYGGRTGHKISFYRKLICSHGIILAISGPSSSKLTMSLVNVALKL